MWLHWREKQIQRSSDAWGLSFGYWHKALIKGKKYAQLSIPGQCEVLLICDSSLSRASPFLLFSLQIKIYVTFSSTSSGSHSTLLWSNSCSSSSGFFTICPRFHSVFKCHNVLISLTVDRHPYIPRYFVIVL